MDRSRDCTQHPDFKERVYQRIREKYRDFHLPHTWIQTRHRGPNIARLLNAGMETPGSQRSTPKLFTPNWGKQKLIKSLSYKPASLTHSPVVRSPYNSMLSTQFNSSKSKLPVPLFSSSGDVSPVPADGLGIVLDEDLFSDPVTPVKQSTGTSVSLAEALSNAFHGKNKTPKSVDPEPVKIEQLTPQSISCRPDSNEAPFINFHRLTEPEQKQLKDKVSELEVVAVALFYSDHTSNLLLQSARKNSLDKVTVSGVVALLKSAGTAPLVSLFLPVSASGDNDSSSVSFLRTLFSSPVPKVTFNAYQLHIVCNILTKAAPKGGQIEQLTDLKIAAWLLYSDEVPQTLPDLLARYEVSCQSAVAGAYHRLSAALEALLEANTVVQERLAEEKLTSLFTLLETPLMGTTCLMGQTGISIDRDRLSEISRQIGVRLGEVEKEASSVLGRPVLLTSPTQLRQILYEELHLDSKIPDKVARTSVLKEKSTSEPCLLKMTSVHPLPRLILQHRRLSKTKSTYLDGIVPFMRFGKLYPSWDQTSASTGRLTSFNPNIQAFPKEPLELGEAGEVTVRDIVIPAPGHCFVAVDFCSIELRILAHFAKDQELVDAITGEGDVFVNLTATWRNIAIDQVTPEDRTKTKRVCYAIIYGVGIPKLSEILKVSFDEAKMLMNGFLRRFQNISRFTNAVINRARQTKKLRTILFRLRHFAEINSPNFALRKAMERQAVNFVIQGSAADICKLAMLKVNNGDGDPARLLIQIHDELLYEVAEGAAERFARQIARTLESPEFTREIHLSVALRVKVQIGQSWGQMKDVD